jgi:hypothetical protein
MKSNKTPKNSPYKIRFLKVKEPNPGNYFPKMGKSSILLIVWGFMGKSSIL